MGNGREYGYSAVFDEGGGEYGGLFQRRVLKFCFVVERKGGGRCQ